MCYRNGYGHRCECCGMEKTKKELTAEEKSMVRAVLHFLDIWGDMIEARDGTLHGCFYPRRTDEGHSEG